jgi:NADH-quinone oxidoreductase subunit I
MASHSTASEHQEGGVDVVSVSDRNPGVRTIRVHRPQPQEATFIPATIKGLGITLKHFAKNFFLGRSRNEIETVDYPRIPRRKESLIDTMPDPHERRDEYPEYYPDRYRGLHRLMMRPAAPEGERARASAGAAQLGEDERVRCVACMCCPTVCPAHCITIIPAETDDQGVEKYPAVFEIDELRCVVCGLCVEACPCDAIRMDTGMHAPPVEERGKGIWTKEAMLANKPVHKERDSTSTAVQGGKGKDWREGQ